MACVESGLFVCGLFCTAVGALRFTAALVRRRRTGRHLTNAVPTDGVIDSVNLSGSDAQVPTVRYLDAAGVMRWGTSRGYRPSTGAQIPLFRAGQQVRLLYDPGQPTWVMVDGTVDPANRATVRGMALAGVGAVLLVAATALTLR